MGCTVSRPEFLITTKAIAFESVAASSSSSSSPSSPGTLSLLIPLAHHHPLKKGDTHRLVSLTSTTCGFVLLLDQPSSDHHQNKTVTLESETDENPSPDLVIDDWELMAGLDDFDITSKPNSISLLDRSYSVHNDCSSSKKPFFSRSRFAKKLYSFFEPTRSETSNSNSVDEGRVKKLCNSFESSADAGENINNSSMKPLWKHLPGKSLLADIDPNVESLSRRAMSSRQSAFTHSQTFLFNNRIRLPGTEDKIVVYFTSLRGIRRTYEDCCAVRNIFGGFRVPVDERDISMDSAYRRELQNVLEEKTVSLPQVFIGGRYIGGAEEIKQLHEIGELAKILEVFPVRDPRFICESCGDARFVLCLDCNGSRKVFDEDEEKLRRCLACNENGLIRCPSCAS